jgi:hypothetical protein
MSQVKYFTFRDPAIPQLEVGWTDLIVLLRAVLVNGYGVKAFASATWESGILSFSVANADVYQPGRWVDLYDCDDQSLNGTYEVQDYYGGVVKLKVSVAPQGPGPYAGTVRVSPAGWSIVHDANAVTVFKNAHPTSPCYLRVESKADVLGSRQQTLRWSRVTIHEGVSSYGDRIGREAPFDWNDPTFQYETRNPTSSTATIGFSRWFFAGSRSYDAWNSLGYPVLGGIKPFNIVADDKVLYLNINPNISVDWHLYAAGTFKSNIPGDRLHSFLFTNYQYTTAINTQISVENGNRVCQQGAGLGLFAISDANNSSNSAPLTLYPTIASPARMPTSGHTGFAYPEPVTGRVNVTKTLISSNDAARGELPGVFWHHGSHDGRLQPGMIIDDVEGLTAKKFMWMGNHVYNGGHVAGPGFLIDISGPLEY